MQRLLAQQLESEVSLYYLDAQLVLFELAQSPHQLWLEFWELLVAQAQ